MTFAMKGGVVSRKFNIFQKGFFWKNVFCRKKYLESFPDGQNVFCTSPLYYE